MTTRVSDAALPDQSLKRYAFPALLFGGLSVGCAPILVRLSEVGPSATAFWRVSLALVPLALVAALIRDRSGADASPRTARDWLEVSLPGVFLGLELCIWHVSLHMTSVANATLLVNMTPVFAALIGWAAFGRPVGRAFMAGVAVAIMGVATLTNSGSGEGAGSLSGDAVALAAAAIYAGYFLTLARARRRFAAMPVMLATTAAAALVTLPLALAEGPMAPATSAGWVSLVALAWIVQGAGQGLVTFAIAWLSPTVSSLVMLIQPVVAAAIAWSLFDERLTALQILGGAAVLGGIMIARRG